MSISTCLLEDEFIKNFSCCDGHRNWHLYHSSVVLLRLLCTKVKLDHLNETLTQAEEIQSEKKYTLA